MGIMYAKAMGHKVRGISITDAAIQGARDCGADYTFNSSTDKEWKESILEITRGGVHAVVNFTASKKDPMMSVLRLSNRVGG